MTVEQLHKIFEKNHLTYFTGVPDSTFKSWMSYLADNKDVIEHRIAVNEGAAIAHATGYHLATGKVGVVYLQNSGLGNCVNPLTSLTDEKVYAIPMLLMIGWRGEPGVKDEPQHVKMGAITKDLLDVMGVPYFLLEQATASEVIEKAKRLAVNESKPVALIVKKSFLESYSAAKTVTTSTLTREQAIETIIQCCDKESIVVGTTGKTSRELFELRVKHKQTHAQDFYTVGSMGHANAIALEIALQKPDKQVYVLDGDGALLMHMGAMATIGYYAPSNLVHVLLDNGCHESTGAQPTVSNSIDFVQIAKGCSYRSVCLYETLEDVERAVSESPNGPNLLIIKIRPCSRHDLGRPTLSPTQNKETLMTFLNGKGI